MKETTQGNYDLKKFTKIFHKKTRQLSSVKINIISKVFEWKYGEAVLNYAKLKQNQQKVSAGRESSLKLETSPSETLCFQLLQRPSAPPARHL